MQSVIRQMTAYPVDAKGGKMRKAETGLRSNAIRSISDDLIHAAFESTAKEGEALVNVLKGIKQMLRVANRNDDTLSNIAHLSSVVALRFEKLSTGLRFDLAVDAIGHLGSLPKGPATRLMLRLAKELPDPDDPNEPRVSVPPKTLASCLQAVGGSVFSNSELERIFLTSNFFLTFF